MVIAAEDGQFTAFEFRDREPLEIGERHKVQVLFERPVSRCFWEAGVTGVNEFPAGCVNRIGVDAESFGYASAKPRQFGIRWAPDGHAGLPALLRLTVNLTAVIPDEINRARLTSQSAANRTGCILDAVSVGKDRRSI
jgi:hypothetical protein